MAKMAVKIRSLRAPDGDLSSFDPGAYLSALEFYETAEPVTEDERDGLAQLAPLLAYFALEGKSDRFGASVIGRETTAYQALEAHFGHLPGWKALSPHADEGLEYGKLVRFLWSYYPPHS